MVAPDVVNPEVLSTLRRLERTGEFRPAGPQAIDDLHGRRRAPLRHAPAAAGGVDARANVTALDACYVALARILRCPLVTGDRGSSRAPGLGVPLVTV